MTDLFRACLGRSSTGMWRSKRQFTWIVAALALILILYVHFSPSDKLGWSRQRVLTSIDKNDGSTGEQSVKFLGPHDNLIPSIQSDIIRPVPPVESNDVEVDKNGFNAGNGEIIENNIGNEWSFSSDRKYNSFGEPVYSHNSHPLYVPKHRVIHIDLKGAPPKVSAFKTFLPLLAQSGATAVLLEYEDMFPWEGTLSPIRTKNHYSKEDIAEILDICKRNKLEVIPLVQTFGHLEYTLKHEPFMSLREVPEMPTAICPSLNESVYLVHKLIDQTMALHKGVKYLHIGCDEVFQMGECERCRLQNRETIFLSHVSSIASYVIKKFGVKPIIWHDMLSHVSERGMKDYKFGELLEPMVWVYAEDVYRFVQPGTWSKFAEIFPRVWAASAFKGAFKEMEIAPNVRRHLDNNLNWLDVMAAESSKFKYGFAGIVITGWQRFDHFAVLTELIPAAMPSIIINLIATSNGYFNSSLNPKIYKVLNCMEVNKYDADINLDSDPFLWDKFSWCFFPGSLFFKVTARLDAARKDVNAYIEKIWHSRGFITEYNIRHNSSLPTRVDEDLEELPSRLHTVTMLVKTAKEALEEWFDVYTVGEWIELHIWPLIHQLETLQKQAESLKLRKVWPARPYPLLKELQKYGISENPNSASSKTYDNL